MRPRRAAGLAAVAVLVVGGLLPRFPGEWRRRSAMLTSGAGRSLAERRFRGSGAGFDRGYVLFLEALRHRVPPGSEGIAILLPAAATEPYLYLGSYHLAPVPVLIAPGRVPPRWLAAAYGPIPPGWRAVEPLPGGARIEPAL